MCGSEPGPGGPPMMPASMNGAPVSSMSVAMRTTVCGAMALHSANAGRAPVRAIAPATSSAMPTASAGGSTESSRSHSSTSASVLPASRMPASAARSRVSSLRPVRSVATSTPPDVSIAPMAAPMSPGLMMPTGPVMLRRGGARLREAALRLFVHVVRKTGSPSAPLPGSAAGAPG